jgi:hypothetical protein
MTMKANWIIELAPFSQASSCAVILVVGKLEDGTEVKKTIMVHAGESSDAFVDYITALPYNKIGE